MDRVKRTRRPIRAAVTRTITELDAELAKEEPDRDLLTVITARLQEQDEQLSELDQRIMDTLLDQDCTDEEQDEECIQCEGYRRKIALARRAISKLLEGKPPSVSESDLYTATEGGTRKERSFKLPKIELKTFNGDLKDWLQFWSQFQKIDEDESLHASDKFQYLIQAMQPETEARDIVCTFPATGQNYPKAVQALKDRYGNESLLLQVYIRELLKLVINNATQKETVPLAKMYLKLESHLQALATLNLETADPSSWLFPLVESSLPTEILRAWQRSPLSKGGAKVEAASQSPLQRLREFLKEEVENEQKILLAQAGFQNEGESDRRKKSAPSKTKGNPQSRDKVPTAAALYTGEKILCIFCEKPHGSDKCGRAQSMSLQEKIQMVKNKNGCLSCLKRNHWAKSCKAFIRCPICSHKHEVLMCPELPKHQSEKTSGAKSDHKEVQNVVANFAGSTTVYLGTFRTTLVNGNKRIEVRALLDSGAQRSYLSSRAAAKLQIKPQGAEKICHSLFGGVNTPVKSLHTYQVQSLHCKGSGFTILNVLETDQICSNIPKLTVGPWMNKLKQKRIWISDLKNHEDQEIDLLIGADFYGRLLTGCVHQLDANLTAIETKLGWVVMGPKSNSIDHSSHAMSVINMFVSDTTSPEQLWSLEAIGIQDPGEHRSKVERERAAKEHFMKTVSRYSDGRYAVKLPWTCTAQEVVRNRKVAEARLNSATYKLLSSGNFATYDKVFKDWIQEGIIEEVSSSSDESGTHYLPHRPVFKESKTTPVRPVFDASCKVGRNPSLNECLEKGPNLIELIPDILHRFRERKIGVISDIRKAFQMIAIQDDDRNFLRFLWWEDADRKLMKVFRHCRVVFGVNCSPFLLGAVLEFHLNSFKEKDSVIAQKLLKSLYVDNCVTSVESTQEYEKFKSAATVMLADAKMELREWERTTSSSESSVEGALTSVLGYKWDKEKDILMCDFQRKETELPDKISKRIMLSKVQQVFDPLGFLCPTMIKPKLLLQQAWAEKPVLGGTNKKTKDEVWDSPLSKDLEVEFRDWWEQSNILGDIGIPRSLRRNYVKEEIHVFGDASKDAYATVAYLRTQFDDGVTIQLIQAKSRVSPLKKMSIPRLELVACTISVRMLMSIKEALNFDDTPTYLWSDSTTALSWIRRNDDWGTFVGNRVREILKTTKVEQWKHVPGVINPADLPSRGCTPRELLQSKWWEGPEWLRQPKEQWPHYPEKVDEEAILKEKKKSTVVMAIQKKEVPWYVKRSSSYSVNVRLLAWILRFTQKCRNLSAARGELTVEEINAAENQMFRLVQIDSFEIKNKERPIIAGFKVNKKEDGIIYLKTRLENRKDSALFRHPILLPNNCQVVDQLIREEHIKNNHAGIQTLMGILREKVWILQTRKAIKRIISQCVKCRRHTTKSPGVHPAPLPSNRVKDAKTFQITGVDLAGPLFLKKNVKAWVVIFTCAIYRGVHLEMVTSLSTEDFLLALHRFVSRRGRPDVIYSDNGTNFVGAANLFNRLDWDKISKETRTQRIKWIFNPPSAAWWGEWWERLVRTLKGLLKRVLGRDRLLEVQLQTCLCEIEATMNCRPLTYVTEDSEDLIPLSPQMFMSDLKSSDFPEEACLDADELRAKFKGLGKLKEELRSRFRKEYLAQLVHRGKSKKIVEFQVGDIVLVGSDNKKRQDWPIAKIIELIPGSDGNIRVAKIKTASGDFVRPLQRLYPLEVTSGDLMPKFPIRKEPKENYTLESKPSQSHQVIKTRSGRAVKKPDRL